MGTNAASSVTKMPPDHVAAALARHEAERALLIRRRLKAGLWILIGAIASLGVTDMLVSTPEAEALAPVRLLQMGLLLVTLGTLRLPILRPWPVPVALISIGALGLTISATGIVRQDVVTASLLFTILTMGLATLVPWGVGPQAVAVAVSAGAVFCNVAWTDVSIVSIGYPIVAVLVAFVTSVYVAREFEAYRRTRAAAEQALATQARLEVVAEEAEIWGALARVGREMVSSLESPVILDRLCRLTTEALQCDCCYALLWDERLEAYTVVSGHGDGPQYRTLASEVRLSRAVTDHLGPEPSADEWTLTVDAGVFDEPPEDLLSGLRLASGLWVPLRRRGEVIGILAAGYRGRNPTFTERQQRIAAGIAQISSLAVTNARLLETIERAGRVKAEFLQTISHELRTPLTLILGLAELLAEPDIDAVQRNDLTERITRAGRTLLGLVETTLEIGGPDGIRLEAIELPVVWQALGRECAGFPRANEVAFHWSRQPPSVRLVTDSAKLRVVVRSLVMNALKFTEQGWVSVEAIAGDGAVILRVSDTGVGIAPEDREAIFEMFRQSDGSTRRRHEGAGLGLYVTRRFVERLGGTIEVESTLGKGAVFTVTLPVAGPALEQCGPSPRPPDPPGVDATA